MCLLLKQTHPIREKQDRAHGEIRSPQPLPKKQCKEDKSKEIKININRRNYVKEENNNVPNPNEAWTNMIAGESLACWKSPPPQS